MKSKKKDGNKSNNVNKGY